MRELSEILYSPLKEEDRVLTGWSKSTVSYALNHKTKVYNTIGGIAKSLNKILQKHDLDDVYQEILNYLYTCDDYNISKACERSSNGSIVSLEGYVHSCIKYCVIRYVTKTFEDESHTVKEISKDEDGKELSIFDTIADTKDNGFSDFYYDIETICKSFEAERYIFGPDIFQIWYIRLLTIVYKKEEKYEDILVILGISRKDMANIQKESHYDGAMLSIAKAISITGVEQAVSVIEKYTYSANKIRRVVELF